MSTQPRFSETFRSIAYLNCNLSKAHLPTPLHLAQLYELSLNLPSRIFKLYKGNFLDPLINPDADWGSLFRFESTAELNCNLTKANLAIPLHVAHLDKELLKFPSQLFKLYKGIFLDPQSHPDADWGSLFRFCIFVLILAISWNCIMGRFLQWLKKVPEDLARSSCIFCCGSQKDYKQIGRREILKLLIEAQTPGELWYDVKLLSKRNGVRTESEVMVSKRRRCRGFNVRSLDSDEGTLYLRQAFELGRNSVLREVREKTTEDHHGMKEWCDILREYKDGDIDQNVIKRWKKEKPPLYGS